ncbi:sulfite exporter TauE/SafE family protein [Alkaliphilus sp. MSJ-5]|uniref:Probable membrane transporter protein n=1 Tax=Alkaliphilus flagellatus TaxID=2841507 RepID=A0ABS6G7S0_9FIRM|nr:sulfite exporter TauE/SafE family protein [Alkaliphilus flagellatus]
MFVTLTILLIHRRNNMEKFIYWLKIALIGFFSGIINGLFGAGGGTVAVLALTLIFGISQHKAQATAISIILPLSLISGFIYYKNGFTTIDITFKVALGGIIGSYIGSNALNKIPANYLRKIFGFFIIVAAIRMVFL